MAMAQKNEQYHNALEAQKLLNSWIVAENDFIGQNLGKLLHAFEVAVAPKEEGLGQENKGRGVKFLVDEVEKAVQ